MGTRIIPSKSFLRKYVPTCSSVFDWFLEVMRIKTRFVNNITVVHIHKQLPAGRGTGAEAHIHQHSANP